MKEKARTEGNFVTQQASMLIDLPVSLFLPSLPLDFGSLYSGQCLHECHHGSSRPDGHTLRPDGHTVPVLTPLLTFLLYAFPNTSLLFKHTTTDHVSPWFFFQPGTSPAPLLKRTYESIAQCSCGPTF